ncbi:hypothetical protein FRC0418_01897 [Corynebacterium diphtheriae]|uniref:hypothetical protein n=1 Tax=Corynebacterium diphtheriae TaxID=1717 RepID=UPI0013CB7FFB|nr:hypothetical protein [Corynebacterium diphtheriae]MBG9277308.1 hypothetical protein [Corynebacterium diphtheriae bv. mitis]MBG9281713.1 hypothetical protein [Corynebacterium diphtheriae bv. mitis]CAB0914652.1 hypothetical protein FRC0418_01897 [Corynebacterium diphtheriae]CAB0917261.1 hypothetical protein FRC0425_02067 [Corynebacterium diphtheriae]CAB0966963.1 hypothetical protein FRC0448_01868 [Corynebacterium diphtheriae]
MARLVLEPVVQELVLAQAVAEVLGFFAFEACFVFLLVLLTLFFELCLAACFFFGFVLSLLC